MVDQTTTTPPPTPPQVVITSDLTKLPAGVAALLDPAQPLPAGVVFFEKRYEAADVVKRLFWCIGFGFAALIIIPFGVMVLFDRQDVTRSTSFEFAPLGFGLVCGLASWMMFTSIGSCRALRIAQSKGLCTRKGLFLFDDFLVQSTESDTTVIPITYFRGLNQMDVKYEFNALSKSYRLPANWINATAADVQNAIRYWSTNPES